MKFIFASLALLPSQAALAAGPIASGACAVSPSEPHKFNREQIAAAVTPIAERASREEGVVGFSIGISHRGEPIYIAGFGTADLERQVPASAATQYDIGSIGKMFTAVAALQLVERGLLDLDRKASFYLPNYKGPLGNATIRSLLTHTSGYRDGPFPDDTTRHPELERPQSTVELLTMPALSEGTVMSPEGEAHLYSNAGFVLAGLVIEAVTGRTYGEVVRDEIFSRARMLGSSAGELPAGPSVTTPYMRVDGQPVVAPLMHLSVYGGAGSIVASVQELLAFQCALNAGELIKPQSLDTMRAPTTVAVGQTSIAVPYGMATRHSHSKEQPSLGHTGTWSGGTAFLAHYPRADLTIAIMANTFGQGVIHSFEIGRRVAQEILSSTSPEFSRKPLPVDEEFARLLTGRYQFMNSVADQVWEEGELRAYDPKTRELKGRLYRVGPLETIYISGSGEPPTEFSDGQVTSSTVDFWSSDGRWVFNYSVGGLFSSMGRRIVAEPSE